MNAVVVPAACVLGLSGLQGNCCVNSPLTAQLLAQPAAQRAAARRRACSAASSSGLFLFLSLSASDRKYFVRWILATLYIFCGASPRHGLHFRFYLFLYSSSVTTFSICTESDILNSIS
jgi:hypothetical protein